MSSFIFFFSIDKQFRRIQGKLVCNTTLKVRLHAGLWKSSTDAFIISEGEVLDW